MLEFLNLKSDAFGLDISDLSIKFVKLAKKKKFLSLSAFGEAKLSPGIIEGGTIKDEKALTLAIQDALAGVHGKQISAKYVAASLPEEKAFLQVIQMPRMKIEELQKAVYFEAENYIPLPIGTVYLDFQIVPPVINHLDHTDVLIAALPKTIVDSYLSCLEKAGLKPLALEVESLAIARALVPNGISPTPVLLIDLGETRTSIIIFSGRSVRLTGSIPVSSQKLTEIISRALKINLAEAEKLKLKYGLSLTGKNREEKESRKIFDALVPPLVDLKEQIKKYLDYYQFHAGHEHTSSGTRTIQQIYLCGGGANLLGLADFLSLELQIPTELGNPWINILPSPIKEVPELRYKESLKYATALGLALRGKQPRDKNI